MACTIPLIRHVEELQRSLHELQVENNDLHNNQRRRHISPQRDSRVDDLRSQLETVERDYKRVKHEKQRLQEELDELRDSGRASRRSPQDYYSGAPPPPPSRFGGPDYYAQPSPASHWNQQIFVSPSGAAMDVDPKPAPSAGLFQRLPFVTNAAAAQRPAGVVSGRDAARALNESLNKSEASGDSSDLETFVHLNSPPNVASAFLDELQKARNDRDNEKIKDLFLVFANNAVKDNNANLLKLLSYRGVY